MNKKIKSITIYKKDLYLGNKLQNEGKGYKHSYTQMDMEGNIVLDVHYNEDGSTEEKYINKYDSSGKLIEEISYLNDEEIAEHKTHEFDHKGKLLKTYKHYADGSKDMIEYAYDDAGNLSEKTTMDSDHEAEAKELLEWNEKNLLLHRVFEFDELVSEETITYDDRGNKTEIVKWTVEDGNMKMKFEYNDKNEVIKSLTYNDDDKLINKALYEYDDLGRPCKADYESVRGKSITTMVYDQNGNVTEQTEVNDKGEINNRAVRKFNERNEVIETSVVIDFHGARMNQKYILTYEYEYYV